MTPEEKERLSQLLDDLDTLDESVTVLHDESVNETNNPFQLDDTLAEINRSGYM